MYQADSHLPHLLPPSAYYDKSVYQCETELMRSSWHLVGTTAELDKSGDYITAYLFGNAIHVRNFGGQLRALSNVCAHRHCLISHKPSGRSPTMQCQYHGWEYGGDGRTKRIPQSKNFAPIDREQLKLPIYRLETCGQLVFVCLEAESPGLKEFLGATFELIQERFGSGWRSSLTWNASFDVNWKIPVENSLESYHVPNVHANSFKADPGEECSHHIIETNFTAFQTKLPFCRQSTVGNAFQWLERSIVRLLRGVPTDDYWHYHVFPNLLFSFTDVISLVHCVIPTGPQSAIGVARQLGRADDKPGPRKLLGTAWGKLKATITKGILLEDLALYASIQRGLSMSPHEGVLGRCEERIYHFHRYLAETNDRARRSCSEASDTSAPP